jgi:hypothetical protein
MNNERFSELLAELRSASLDTLLTKNSNYATKSDPLHNFRTGAYMIGGTPAQAAWGYMVKHLVSLHDKIERNDFTDRDDLLEKLQDCINYLCFIWAIANDD